MRGIHTSISMQSTPSQRPSHARPFALPKPFDLTCHAERLSLSTSGVMKGIHTSISMQLTHVADSGGVAGTRSSISCRTFD